MSERQTLQLTRQVYFNRSGVLLLSVTLIATVLTIWAIGSDEGQRQVLLAISTGLYASTLYAFLETGLTALRYEAVLHETVRGAVQDALTEALDLSATQQREFLPSTVYPASAFPDPVFNRDLTRDLQRSDRYIFRGVTGRYAIARIINQTTKFESAIIMVGNPIGRTGLGPRITHIVSFAEPDTSYADVQARLVSEIYETVVGARAAAAKCHRLEIHVVDDPQVDRVEFMDSCLYLTLFSETTDGGAKFPKTLRFDVSSSIYRIYAAQLTRSSGTADFNMPVRPDTTDEDLSEILRRLGHPDCDAATVRQYEESFRTFANGFRPQSV